MALTLLLRVACPAGCGAVLRFADPSGESRRHRTRAVVNAHLLAAHPTLRPRERSLLLDEAVAVEVPP